MRRPNFGGEAERQPEEPHPAEQPHHPIVRPGVRRGYLCLMALYALMALSALIGSFALIVAETHA